MAYPGSGIEATSQSEATLDLKTDLFNALDAIETPGSFASFVSLAANVRPDIVVQNVGPITIPLSESQARQLAAKAHQVPYGEGSETLVDTAVRNTWEIGPDQFEIRNPEWNAFLHETLLPHVAKELGITTPVSAELYKMLLYEQGAMFKPHTDTEKIPGMFGTLVISLPSPHTGGDVIVNHCGIKKTFQTSAVDMSCVTWYSDVVHEVCPVTSGYRWVLTYNLATNTAEERPSAALIREENRELREVFEAWSQQVASGRRSSTPLYVMMDHKYTEANISLDGLKARDKAVVCRLFDICSEMGFDLFLTTLEREATDPTEYDEYDGYGDYGRYDKYDRHWEDDSEDGDECDHYSIDEPMQKSYRAKIIFDLNGTEVVSEIPIEEDDILQDDLFGDEPDHEEYEGYMGNSGPDVTHLNRQAAVIIVPSRGTFPLLSKVLSNDGYMDRNSTKPPGFVTLGNYYTRICLDPQAKELSLNALYRLCQAYWVPEVAFDLGVSVMPHIGGPLLCQILQVCLVHDEQRIFNLFAAHDQQPVPLEFFTWSKEKLAQGSVPWEKLKFILLRSIKSQPRIALQYAVISELNPDVDDGFEEMRDVIQHAADESLKRCGNAQLYKEDGSAVFNLAMYYKDFQYLRTVLSPMLENCAYTPFMLEFLKMLRQCISRKQVPYEEALDVYRSLAKSTMLSISFSTVTSFEAPHDDSSLSRYGPALPNTARQSPFFLDYRALLSFIASLFKFNLDEHLECLASKLCIGARMIKGQEFNLLYIPLLQGLVSLLEEHKIPLSTSRYQQVFQTMLPAYLTNYVQRQPSKVTLQRNRVSCSCCDCAPLNRFLVSASQKVERFSFGQTRRNHLISQLSRAGIDCIHTTEMRGSPHTLVVTKTTKLFDKANWDWQERKLVAENNIFAFDQTTLKALLDTQYDDIVSMRHISEATSGFQSVVPLTAAGTSQFSVPTPSFTTSGQSRPSLSAPSFATPGQSRPPLAPTSGNPQNELARLQAEIARAVDADAPAFSSVKPTTQPSRSVPAYGNPHHAVSRLQADITRAAMSGWSGSISTPPTTYPPPPAYASSYYHNPAPPACERNFGLSRHTYATPSLAGIKRKAADVFDDDGDEIEVIDLTCDSD